jgi:hypothetical protein
MPKYFRNTLCLSIGFLGKNKGHQDSIVSFFNPPSLKIYLPLIFIAITTVAIVKRFVA